MQRAGKLSRALAGGNGHSGATAGIQVCLDSKGLKKKKKKEGVGIYKELLLALYMYLSVKVLGREEVVQ